MACKNGLFIALEGMDGCGKTTVAKQLETKFIDKGYKVVLAREPGGTAFAENIRNILMGYSPEDKPRLECQLMLFLASRIDHLYKVILPALIDNKIVICDRYIDSTFIYQGKIMGLHKELEEFQNFKTPAIHNIFIRPDVTLFLDISVEDSLARISGNRDNNSFDEYMLEHSQLLYNCYASHFTKLIETDAAKVIRYPINNTLTKEEIVKDVWDKLIIRLGILTIVNNNYISFLDKII